MGTQSSKGGQSYSIWKITWLLGDSTSSKVCMEEVNYFVDACCFEEKVNIYHGKTRIATSRWHNVNDAQSLKCSRLIMVQQSMFF